MIFALMYLAGCAAIVLVPVYVGVWFAIEIGKSCRIWRKRAAAKQRGMEALRRERDAGRYLVGCDL